MLTAEAPFPEHGRSAMLPASTALAIERRMARGGQRARMRAREEEAARIAASLSFADTLDRYRAGACHPAEVCAVYVAERVHRAAGARWLQADRQDRPAHDAPGSPWLRLFAERELCQVPRPVPQALLAWAAGERAVELYFHVPTARELLALQARGRRCVSLLADGVPTAPHADGLAFAVHDLCHLEKFTDPAFFTEQVGLFSLLDRAFDDPRWQALEAGLDDTYRDDRDHVLADMNGSSVFLFLVLKNKLKLGIRRKLARDRGAPPPTGGPLDLDETAALLDAETLLFDLLALDGAARQAASALDSRGNATDVAIPLVDRFRAEGERVLTVTRGATVTST